MNPQICILVPDSTSESHPDIWFVSAAPISQDGDGSLERPFGSLSQALAGVSHRYSIIYLLSGTHDLDANYESKFLYPMVKFSLYSKAAVVPSSKSQSTIAIRGYRCSADLTVNCAKSPPILRHINRSPVYFSLLYLNMTISDVIFDGGTTLIDGCDLVECSYCQYTTTDVETGTVKNQLGQRITQGLYASETQCIVFATMQFITILSGSVLTVENVTFRNFRQEMNAIISGYIGSQIWLFNVNFSDIKLLQEEFSAVIKFHEVETSLCYSTFLKNTNTTLVYQGGVVELLNRVVEFNQMTVLPGFLAAHYMASVNIHNVTFRLNRMALVNEYAIFESQSLGALLYLQSAIHLAIDNCTFQFNYGTQGSLLRIDADFIHWRTLVWNTDMAYLVPMTHYSISDCTFGNNSALESLLSWSFTADLQNIEITRCRFRSILSFQGTLMSIMGNSGLKSSGKLRSFFAIRDRFNFRYPIATPQHWIILSNISLMNVYHMSGLLLAQNVSNVVLRNIELFESGEAGIETMFSITFAEFAEKELLSLTRYTSSKPPPCRNGFVFQFSYNISISHLVATDVKCSSGPAVIDISESSDVTINDSAISSSNPAKFSSLTWVNVNQSDCISFFSVNVSEISAGISPIVINSSNVTFDFCNFATNSGLQGGALHFSNSVAGIVRNCRFERLSAESGGVAYIHFSFDSASSLRIDSSAFVNNTATWRGGVLYIEQTSHINNVSFEISNSYFTANAGDGVIAISPGVNLNYDSRIAWTKFVGNDGVQSAPLILDYDAGMITVEKCQFVNNTGVIASVIYVPFRELKGIAERSLRLFSVTMENNVGKMISVSDLSHLGTANVSFSNNINTGLILKYTKWTDEGSLFRNNTSTVSVLEIAKKSEIKFLRTIFENNRAELSGACVSIDGQSSVICVECQFVGNSAGKYGGVAIIRQNSLLNVFDSEFRGNEASIDGASLYFLGSVSESRVDNCTFTENRSSGGLISLLSSSLTVTHSCVRNNTSLLSSPGIVLNLSNITVTHSDFLDQRGVSGVYFYLQGGSFANISQCSFTRGVAKLAGGAIAVLSSEIQIASCTFIDLIGEEGAAIYAYDLSSVDISDSHFEQMSLGSKGVITAYESAIQVSLTSFSNFNTSALLAEKSLISFQECDFYHGSSFRGAALSCSYCQRITVQDCSLRDLSSVTGGAVFISRSNTQNAVFWITGTVFESNSAYDAGGAVFAEDANASIANSTFYNNSVCSSADGRGGAVSLQCYTSNACKYTVAFSNFVSNVAEVKGGAIAWDSAKPTFVENFFEGNQAKYGKDVASFPARLTLLTPNVRKVLSNFPSGQATNTSLQFALVDHYGTVIETDLSTLATMIPMNISKAAVKGISMVQASCGVFTFSNFIISAAPGSEVAVMVVSSAVKSGEGNSVILNVSLRKCEIGEMETHNECISCPSGTYSFQPASSCNECPPEAKCYGNVTVVPRAGYWHASNTSENFFKCFNPDACLSVSQANVSATSYCETGYEGTLCQVCSLGFYYISKNVCMECPSRWLNVLKICGISLIFIGILFLMVRSALKSAIRPASTLAVNLKILMNYLQVIMLISNLDMSWPPILDSFFLFHKSVGGATDSLLSFDCFLDQTVSEAYYQKLIAVSVLPVFDFFVLFLIWTVISLIKQDVAYLRHQLLASTIILFFTLQPGIVKTSFNVFSCYEIDGKHYLKEVMSEECWSGTHLKYAFRVALPSAIIWSFGLPAICLFAMIRVKKRLEEHRYKLRFGFLSNGFKQEAFYYEFVILLRKLCIVIASTCVRSVSRSVEALSVFIVLFAAVLLQHVCSPFTTAELNSVELMSTIIAAITMFVGLFFLLAEVSEGGKLVMFVFVLGLNFALFTKLIKMPITVAGRRVKRCIQRCLQPGAVPKLEKEHSPSQVNCPESSSAEHLEIPR